MANGNLIENSGSEARDHLANERTLLAWLRTALGVVGLGAVVAKVVAHAGRSAGLSLIGLGAVVLIYGVVRYLRVMAALKTGHFPVAGVGPVVVAIVAVLAAVFAGLAVAW